MITLIDEPFACISLYYVRSHQTAACIRSSQARTEPPGLDNESILSGQTLENPNLPG